MTKKGKTYLLLAVVLGIWGIIGIKILGAVNPKPTEDLHPKMARAFTAQKIKHVHEIVQWNAVVYCLCK